MGSSGGVGLVCRLQKALEKEQCQWDHWMRKGLHKGERSVKPLERNFTVAWLFRATERLNLALDTMALAIMVMDRVLYTTKVKPKYLQCLALSSLFVACKICEEPDTVPPVQVMVREVDSTCKAHELVHMERVILKRLSWDLSLVTPYTFFQLMLAIGVPHLCQCFSNESRKLFELTFSNYGVSSSYRPSILALAFFSILLENRPDPNWEAMTSQLEELLGISNEEHNRCRDHVTSIWQSQKRIEHPTKGANGLINKTESEYDTDSMKENMDENNVVSRKKRPNELSFANGPYCMTKVLDNSTLGANVELDMSITEIKMSPGQISLEDIFDSVDVLYEISI